MRVPIGEPIHEDLIDDRSPVPNTRSTLCVRRRLGAVQSI